VLDRCMTDLIVALEAGGHAVTEGGI